MVTNSNYKNLYKVAGWNKGLKSKDYRPNYKHSEETLKKISLGNKGKKMSKESRIKISLAKKGKCPWNKGKKGVQKAWNKNKPMTAKWAEKLRLAKLNRNGERANNWQGGLSFEPYPINWNETLRRSIRERDKYFCNLCNAQQGDRVLAVHHIDYNKNNCNPNNLICLCIRCHSKTNNSREKWEAYFKNIMEIRNGS